MSETKFDPVPPKPTIDQSGGRHYGTKNPLPEWHTSEDSINQTEQDLDVKSGELTNEDPADPNYRPATSRTKKWERLRETGEV